METRIGYKLFRKTRTGLAPLFINKSQRLEIGKWYEAECHPTKGFAVREGWHLCKTMNAPHLKLNLKSGEQRVWCKVEYKQGREYDRPESQGGAWILAGYMRIVEVCNV